MGWVQPAFQFEKKEGGSSFWPPKGSVDRGIWMDKSHMGMEDYSKERGWMTVIGKAGWIQPKASFKTWRQHKWQMGDQEGWRESLIKRENNVLRQMDVSTFTLMHPKSLLSSWLLLKTHQQDMRWTSRQLSRSSDTLWLVFPVTHHFSKKIFWIYCNYLKIICSPNHSFVHLTCVKNASKLCSENREVLLLYLFDFGFFLNRCSPKGFLLTLKPIR